MIIKDFSLKIIPIGLAKFVKTFDLRIKGVEGKQYFPYKYSEPQHYDKQLNELPRMVYFQ